MSLADVKAYARSIIRSAGDLEEVIERLTGGISCSECKRAIKVGEDDGDVFCTECAAPPDCDGCGSEMTQGYCDTCSSEKESSARRIGQGHYPHIGINRTGCLQDQILDYLTRVHETCCGARHDKPCARCDDAIYLRSLYAAHLGEIRT